ncbi:PAS domain-containing protein [Fibrella sp. HMF5335]|uniref:histidine kinase n=1 Tax=Fibrella rubiginis TaxID=2817060 RepID=A0A939K455_9BACT|nr:PAS domain-containing sensor histidine kinase [Fibrella rubiginis]MBO0936338.1 PAS domain-containing protein [Fibrella rubiginis]
MPTSLTFSYQELYQLYTKTLEDQRTGVVIFKPVYEAGGQLADLIWCYVSARSALDSHLTVEQMLGQRLLSLFPQVQHTRFWTAYQQVLQTGEAQEWEDRYVGEGLDNYLLTRVERYQDAYLSVSYTQINDLKRAELKAKATAEQMRRIVDGSMSGLMACQAVRDAQGELVDLRIVMTNQAASNINGRSVEFMQGNTLRSLFPALPASGLLERYFHTARTGEVQRMEVPYYHDQIEGWFDIVVSPLEDNGVLLSFADITAIKRLQVQQEQSILELRRSNESLQSFAYVASHDLQEPLRKVQSFGTMLLEQYGPALDEQGQDYLRRMQASAQRMSGLIRDLLAFSRLSAQKPAFKRVALSAVTSQVLTDLEHSIDGSGGVVSIGDLPTVEGDAMQLGQLFQNLLANALRYRRADQSPSIHVSSQLVTIDHLPVGLVSDGLTQLRQPTHRPARYWKIAVADNGIGFDEKYVDRIFGLFQRLHGRSQYEGSGIGLSICKRVVEHHYGAITARSQPGQGATFLVYLPA